MTIEKKSIKGLRSLELWHPKWQAWPRSHFVFISSYVAPVADAGNEYLKFVNIDKFGTRKSACLELQELYQR